MKCECKGSSGSGRSCFKNATHEANIFGKKMMMCKNCVEKCLTGIKSTPLEPEPEPKPELEPAEEYYLKPKSWQEATKLRGLLIKQSEKMEKLRSQFEKRTRKMDAYRAMLRQYQAEMEYIQNRVKEIDKLPNN